MARQSQGTGTNKVWIRQSITVILCSKSIAKVRLALGQYIIGDITPPFYDLQKTVYEGTYFVSDFRAGDSCAPDYWPR